MQKRHILTGTALLALAQVADAGEINTGYFGDVAIRGYDPVAYFTMSKAVEGDPAITLAWLGANWQFATEEHRDLFEEDPISYAPQYGGFCAYGVSVGKKFDGDPNFWTVADGRLYLNLNEEISDTFNKDVAGAIEKADRNWTDIRGKAAGEL